MSLIKKVAFYTLGCKVNQYETESIKKQFLENSYEEVNFNEKADIYLVNSCTVTNIADRKTRNMLRRAKKINEKAKVIVTGCYAQTNAKELEKIEEIDYIIGNSNKDKIFEIVNQLNKSIKVDDIFLEKKYLEMNFSTLREMTRAYIKIQDGCNNFCSYCKIPFARGSVRSRSKEDIMKEVLSLSKEGYKEIILIGINLGAYGEDLKEEDNLENIIENISEVKGIERIRLGSIYPDQINETFIKLLKEKKNLMPHLHISLQSGDDKVLELMKRKYKQEDVRKVLNTLKKELPNISFTGDVIVGFPGEGEEEFENTYNFIKEMKFSNLHIFQYSDREKTLASTYKNKVDPMEKKRRLDKLSSLVDDLSLEFKKNQIGKKMEVLIEEIKENTAYGYSRNYLKVKVKLKKSVQKVNELVSIKVKEVDKELFLSESET